MGVGTEVFKGLPEVGRVGQAADVRRIRPWPWLVAKDWPPG